MAGNSTPVLPKKILIIRMSAIGDVVMTIPVLYSLAKAYPQAEFTLLTQTSLTKIFVNAPKNLRLIGANIGEIHKGSLGLIKLFNTLSTEKFDAVCDLHDVLRSKVIRNLFRIKRIPVTVVNKEREDRNALIRKNKKITHPLKSNFIRYYEPIAALGFKFPMSFSSIFEETPPESKEISLLLNDAKPQIIGIAPFANHLQKVYPIEKMEIVVQHLASKDNVTIFLFGGGEKEKRILDQWAGNYSNVVSLVGKLDFSKELIIMSKLKVMLSMDSSNMHLAAITGTPVISIWGATHRYAGFLGWNVDHSQCIETDLPCRPCSIYGNKPCHRSDLACLNEIEPQTIINKVSRLLKP